MLSPDKKWVRSIEEPEVIINETTTFRLLPVWIKETADIRAEGFNLDAVREGSELVFRLYCGENTDVPLRHDAPEMIDNLVIRLDQAMNTESVPSKLHFGGSTPGEPAAHGTSSLPPGEEEGAVGELRIRGLGSKAGTIAEGQLLIRLACDKPLPQEK